MNNSVVCAWRSWLRRAAPALWVVCITACPWSPARASDIGVTPVAVHLDKSNDRATVSVVNSGSDPVVMHVEAVAWRRQKDGDEHAPTGDIVINPSVFTVQAGQAQLVRVGLRRTAQAESEATYRIVIREVPVPPRPGQPRISGQVQVLMALRLPVYVAPKQVARMASVQAQQLPDGQVLAQIRNEGNVHIKVGRLQLRTADGEALPGDQVLGGAASVIFPGEERSVRLGFSGKPSGQASMLEMATDQGPQQVPVTVAQKTP